MSYPVADRRRSRHVSFVSEPLENRVLMAAQAAVTTTGLPDVVRGTVVNTYTLSNGTAEQTPLAGWTVYEDENNNGAFDRAFEAGVRTDVDGTFALDVADEGGAVQSTSVRVAPRGGRWTVPAAQVVTAATAQAVTFATRMLSPVVIDLLVAYTPAAARDADAPIADKVRGMVRDANRVFANSDTNARINLLDLQATTYRESGRISTDLTRLQRSNDDSLDEVAERRQEIGADLVTLLTSFASTNGNTIGLAYQYDRTATNNAQYAANVVALQGTRSDGFTLAHEIGHNLGAGHDLANSDGDATAPYAQGYRFFGNDNVRYRDIMAYDPGTELPIFSDPDFVYAGRPAGSAATADNARIVAETAPIAASYRRRRLDPAADDNPAASPARPDLLASAVRAVRSASWRAGERVDASVRVLNEGDARVSRTVAVELYLSDDDTIDASDRRIARKSRSLSLGEARGRTFEFEDVRLSDRILTGTYRLLARVDAGDRVREADETNNVGLGPTVRVRGEDPPVVAQALPFSMARVVDRTVAAIVSGAASEDEAELV
jgi:hypothetical protein